ncbi:hypothetical protein INT45_010579 [Circinella minor]|uniref:Uncharacterized protein n=1 Tax=Circinella minor TaxID=1195481 RepID=A0A8H7RPD3_9FUNG|nr:hypothetical protein INT45_010579 [Circinella minor]
MSFFNKNQCPYEFCGYNSYKSVTHHIYKVHSDQTLPSNIFNRRTEDDFDLEVTSNENYIVTTEQSLLEETDENLQEPQDLWEERVYSSPPTYGHINVDFNDISAFNTVEKEIIKYILDYGLSHVAYKRLVELIELGRREKDEITCKTWKGNFTETTVDINRVPDFPDEYKYDFLAANGGSTPVFYHRDVFDLVEDIFNDPCLENDMVLRPTKCYRGTSQIYTEMHTGDWWHEMQEKIGTKKVVIALQVASDQTVIWDCEKFRAYPIYIKIGEY